MLLIDKILLAPAKGLLFIFEKIHEQVEEELVDTPEKLKKELYDLQAFLGAKQISEGEYKKREDGILERWNALKGKRNDIAHDKKTKNKRSKNRRS